MKISLYDRVENTLGKGENAGYQHFLLFPLCFPKPSFSGLLIGGIVWFRVNPFPKDKFKTLPNWRTLQTTILKLMKMVESSLHGLKTLWEKEKLFVTINFSFFRRVFKRLLLQTHKNQALLRKRLTLYHTVPPFNNIENIVEKGENAADQHFLLFPQCFLPFQNSVTLVACKCFQFGMV